MTGKTIGLATLLAVTLFAATAMAKEPAVSCNKIQQAIKSGKSQQQVATDLKVSRARVKECAGQAK